MTAARICGDILVSIECNNRKCFRVKVSHSVALWNSHVQSMIIEIRLTISSNSSRTMLSGNVVGMSYYQTEPLLMRSFLLADRIANSDVTDMKIFLFYHSS